MSRIARLSFSVLVVSVLLLATAGTSTANDAGATYMKVKGSHGSKPPRGSTLLFSHGGLVETAPTVFIVYGGPQWQSGFTTGGYSSAQAQSYVQEHGAK